eukprot:6476399-Alexandrium_andersonii.AAC.1
MRRTSWRASTWPRSAGGHLLRCPARYLRPAQDDQAGAGWRCAGPGAAAPPRVRTRNSRAAGLPARVPEALGAPRALPGRGGAPGQAPRVG